MTPDSRREAIRSNQRGTDQSRPSGRTTAILRVESGKRLRGSISLVVVFGLLAAMYFAMFPSLQAEMAVLEEAFPAVFFDLFGIEALHTIEGFIAAELYAFFWIVLVGIYFAYSGAGLIATDVDRRAMDLTLSTPVSRESVVLQKVASLWLPLAVLNGGVAGIVLLGGVVIGEPLDPLAVGMVHLLSIPYLLVCAGIGLVLSVSLDRARTARATALTLVFVVWLIERVSRLDDQYEWIGAVGPSRYIDETAILVRQEYAFGDAILLVAGFLVLVGLAIVVFTRRDI